MSNLPDTGNPSAVQEIISRADAKARGLRRFFVGRECKRGHVSEQYVSDGKCCQCVLEKGRARKGYYAKWRSENLERCAEYTRSYRERHPEHKERDRACRLANIKAERERERILYDKNRKKFLLKNEAYRKARPDIFAAHARNRRALAKQAEGRHTAAEIAALYQRQRGKCANCRTSLKPGYHADHIVPLVRGGSNWISNIQLLCPPCNISKNAMAPVEWAQREGRLL